MTPDLDRLRLPNRSQAPPGSWRYRIEALAERAPHLVWVSATTFYDLVNEVNKRCAANGITPPDPLDIENQICQSLPSGYCTDSNGVPTAKSGTFAVMVAAFKQGTKSLITWWGNGKRRVNENEIVRRSYICNQCPENRPIEGCTACAMKGVHALVNQIVADTTLPTDSLLQACAVCQCSLKAKVRFHLDDLRPHIPKSQLARLPEKCWILEEPS